MRKSKDSPLTEKERELAEQRGEELLGTCEDFSDIDRFTDAQLAIIDDITLNCSCCGWWIEPCEDCGEDEIICGDCIDDDKWREKHD